MANDSINEVIGKENSKMEKVTCNDRVVTQPSFRTVHAKKNESFQDEIGTSVLGITEFSEWADVVQERLHVNGIDVVVRGISHTNFLLTFFEKEDKDNWDKLELHRFFKNIKEEVTNLDLIVPRTAWLWCEGLPIIAWNRETWQQMVGDWGYILLNDQCKPLKNVMYQELRLFISTQKVEAINETVKVRSN